MVIEHIAMYVDNLENARDFFVKYFGGRSNDGYHNPITGFRSYFISFDNGPRLEIMNKPEVGSHERTPGGDRVDGIDGTERPGYAHIAFSVGSKQNVDDLTAVLKADGYEVVSGPRTTGDGYYESCIVGIEGNRVEITV